LFVRNWPRTIFKKIGWGTWAITKDSPEDQGRCRVALDIRLQGDHPLSAGSGSSIFTGWKLTRTVVGIGLPKTDPFCAPFYDRLNKPEVFASFSISNRGITKLACGYVSLNAADGTNILPME